MNAPLDIGRLHTRIRSGEPARAQALAGQLRQVAGPRLARALDGAGERALARAGLPAGAMVAVRRLDLALAVATDVGAGQLADGWAAAFEAALARLLARTPAGDDAPEAVAVWFADAWAVEVRHLQHRAAGQPDAWWAEALAGGGERVEAPAASATPGPLDALPILLRWLARDPPRALATMAALARADARVVTLLDAGAARTLTRHLLERFAHAASAAPLPTGGPVEGQPPRPHTARPMEPALARLADLRAALRAALGGPAGTPEEPALAAPWLLATLFARHPALARLPAAAIEPALAHWLQGAAALPPVAPEPPAPLAAEPHPTPADRPDSAAAPPSSDPGAPACHAIHAIHAGGLLLLLRPMARLGLLPPAERLAQGLGDLALTALRRALAPLPPAERAVAQERERPLLGVFAPECDWRERIATLPVHDPAAADALLDALVDAIPADIAFAPGAARRIFGSAQPAFATAAARRLAGLVLRPGQLTVTAWDAELAWPLDSIDLALRRAGWDQDPGWLPWLGRRLRWRFGDAS